MHFNLAELNEELNALKKQMEDPGFWDNIGEANKVNKKIKPLEDKINSYNVMVREFEDAETLLELAEEEECEETLTEAEEEIKKLEKIVAEVRLKALLRGSYDANNAILSLHAGAGGTEAQDWVSMLYRMYQALLREKGL